MPPVCHTGAMEKEDGNGLSFFKGSWNVEGEIGWPPKEAFDNCYDAVQRRQGNDFYSANHGGGAAGLL